MKSLKLNLMVKSILKGHILVSDGYSEVKIPNKMIRNMSDMIVGTSPEFELPRWFVEQHELG